jgi:diguanylate cyclase (GGDEF)-like protein
MRRLRRSAEHHLWLSEYLVARGVARRTRLWLAVTSAAMAAGVLVLLYGAGGPQEADGRALMWVAFAGGMFGTALWLWRWPTHAMSLAFVAVTTVSITAACLAYPDPLAALLGCIAFTTIVGYAAFFHSPEVVAGVLLVVAAVAVDQAAGLAAQGRLALAAVDLFLILQCSIGVALALYSLVRTLRGDLAAADLDPLTGLLNRRAFRRTVGGRLSNHQGKGGYLLTALLDLDDFKAINDTHGHAAGDQALVAVAEALRATATPSAVIARSGGEEFLFADFASAHDVVARYEELCAVIAGLPVSVTASIGTSFADLAALTPRSHNDLLDRLIVAADQAMYDAKRQGGNRCHHYGSVH